MRSLFGTVALAVTLASTGVLLSVANPRADRAHAADVDETVALVRQDLALGIGQELVVQFHPSTPVGDRAIRVQTYEAITNRDALQRAIDGQFGGAIDRVEVTAGAEVDADGNVTIRIPTAADDSADGGLVFSSPGLYPVAVDIIGADGEIDSQLVTFVNRQPAADAGPQASISVAVLASITAPPQLPGTTTPLPADVLASIAELGRYPAGLPISLVVSPEIIARLTPESAQQLGAAMSSGVIMSQPYVPFDPSAVTLPALGDQLSDRLEKQFTERLLEGETAIAAAGYLPRTSRNAWYATEGVTDAGAQTLRSLDVRLLVIPSSIYLEAGGNNAGLTDYSQLFQSVLGSTDESAAAVDAVPEDTEDAEGCTDVSVACIPTAVIDPVLSDRLVDASLSDEQAALYTAADLVTYREFFAVSMSANSRHALVLGPDGPGVANAARIARTVELASATGAANFITIDEFEENSSQAIADGRQLELNLPEPAPTPIDLTPRIQELDRSTLAVAGASSMLVSDEEGWTARWEQTIDTLYSTAISDDEADAAIAAIDAATSVIRSCIKPPEKYTFTLSGGTTNLPLRLSNECDEPLNVKIALDVDGNKVEFPDNELVHEIAPGGSNVSLEVTARTNGTFNVTMTVRTPGGGEQLIAAVTLRARVFTLTGLPQVITGVSLLLLATWWVRNLRRSRRARRSLTVVPSHPSGGG